MEGNFSLLGPIEVLQLLSQARQSGALKVLPFGEVYLEEGKPVHANFKNLQGRQGLLQILALQEGDFRYTQGLRSKQNTLEGSLDSHLLHAIHLIDTRLNLSPFDQIEVQTEGNLATHLTLSPGEFDLLRHINKPLSLLELSTATRLPLDNLIASVSRLTRMGLVKVTSRTPRTVRLSIERLEGQHTAYIDSELLRVWRTHYGTFREVEVKTENRTVRLSAQAKSGAGAQFLVSSDTLFFHDLHVGQEVLVWPAL
jgi:hypothetical protein